MVLETQNIEEKLQFVSFKMAWAFAKMRYSQTVKEYRKSKLKELKKRVRNTADIK